MFSLFFVHGITGDWSYRRKSGTVMGENGIDIWEAMPACIPKEDVVPITFGCCWTLEKALGPGVCVGVWASNAIGKACAEQTDFLEFNVL